MLSTEDITKIVDLGHDWEQKAGNAYNSAQKKYPINSSQSNQAYRDYTTAMQNVRDMYYAAAHEVTQQVASGTDLTSITDATKKLNDSLKNLQAFEKYMEVALDVLTVAVTVTAAVVAPTTVPAAVAAIMNLISAISAPAAPPAAAAASPKTGN